MIRFDLCLRNSVTALCFGMLLSSCVKEREPNVYCDGTNNWKCGNRSKPICDLQLHVCVATDLPPCKCTDEGVCSIHCTTNPLSCIGYADCVNPSSPICDPKTHMCRACEGAADDAQCQQHSAETPYCLASNSINMGQCSACQPTMPIHEAPGCSGMAPVCSPDGVCRKCQDHTECTSGICDIDNGNCAAPSDIGYVDNRGNALNCSGDPGDAAPTNDGSQAKPFCRIQSAVESKFHYIAVAGYGGAAISEYPAFSVADKKVVIVGFPKDGTSNTAATVFINSTNGASVASTAMNTSWLTVDKLTIQDALMPSNAAGVACAGIGPATLVVRRSTIQKAGGEGIKTSQCNVTLDQVTVQNNAGIGVDASQGTISVDRLTVQNNTGGGIKLVDSSGTVSNTLIYNNGTGGGKGSDFGGIKVATTASGTAVNLVNLTVVENSAQKSGGTFYSGIDCAATTTLLNTVVAGGTGGTAGDVSSCASSFSAYTGAPQGSNNIDLTTAKCTEADLFIDLATPNFRPQNTPHGTCQITLTEKGSSMGAPDHDITGAPRPQPAGTSPDIGAYEVP